MACEPARPTAPAEHAQLDLRCLIPVKSSGCPETRGSREESWPVVLLELPSHPLDGQGSEDSGFSAGHPVTLPVLHGATHGEAAGKGNGLAEPSSDGNELEEAGQ